MNQLHMSHSQDSQENFDLKNQIEGNQKETGDDSAKNIQSETEKNVDQTLEGETAEQPEEVKEPDYKRALEMVTGQGDITPEDVNMLVSLSKKLVEALKQMGVTEFTKEKIMEASKSKFMLGYNKYWNIIRSKGDGWLEKAILACPPFPQVYVVQVCLHLGLLDCEEKHFDDLMKRTGMTRNLVIKVGSAFDEKFRAYLKFLKPLGELPTWVNSVDRKVRDEIRNNRREDAYNQFGTKTEELN